MTKSRAYNREQRKRVIKNRKRLMKDTGLEHQHMDQGGRYAKRHPYDCGNAACGLCHGYKNPGCESKNKDEHGKLEEIIIKEMKKEIKEE